MKDDVEAYLTGEMAKAKAQAAKWQRIEEAFQRMLSDLRHNPRPDAIRQSDLHGDQFAELSGASAAEVILRDAGKPLHIKAIVQEMISRGFRQKDPKKLYATLYSNMIRQKKRFKAFGEGRFGLVNSQEDGQ